MKNLIILAGVMISPLLFADVPNTFSAGSPARASEVNENFGSLDSRITALENSSGNSGACANTISWWSKKHEVSYQAKSSMVGQLLTINSVEYRIIDVPFREFGTGELYKIRFPVVASSANVSTSFMTEHTSNVSDCSQFTISGFPAFGKEVTERRTMSLYGNGSSESRSKLDVYYSVSIKVGETNLWVSFYASKTETTAVIAAGDYDFTDDLDFNNINHDQALINAVDDLLDYVEVSKVQ